jgi:nucleoside phosphorylase
MLLRWLVSQAVRNTSGKVMRDAAQEAVRQASHGDSQFLPLKVEDFPQPDVLVLFALSVEATPFIEKLETPRRFRWESVKGVIGKLNGRYVTVLQTGVGMQGARQMVERVAPALSAKTKWVSAGFAGALSADLKRGDILMPSQVTDGTRTIAISQHISAAAVEATPYLHVGSLLTVDHVVTNPKERAKLFAQHDSVACDMETAAIALTLRQRQLSMTSVRIISDNVDDKIPKEISSLLSQSTIAGKLGAATGALFTRPSAAQDLWKLRAQANRAAQRLAGFLNGVVEQL